MSAAAMTAAPGRPDVALGERLSYALSKQVPDMSRGFTIQTNYGDIWIEAGPGAERIRKAVETELSRGVPK